MIFDVVSKNSNNGLHKKNVNLKNSMKNAIFLDDVFDKNSSSRSEKSRLHAREKALRTRSSIITVGITFAIAAFAVVTACISTNNSSSAQALESQVIQQYVEKDDVAQVRDILTSGMSSNFYSIISENYYNTNISFAALQVQSGAASSMTVPASEWGEGQNAPVAPGNAYVPGQCTWYAYNRRAQMGMPIGGQWGNAGQWAASAQAAGFVVDSNPKVGDVFIGLGISSYGHVAIVEEVGPNNTVRISEMNYGSPFTYHERWISNASSFVYIH